MSSPIRADNQAAVDTEDATASALEKELVGEDLVRELVIIRVPVLQPENKLPYPADAGNPVRDETIWQLTIKPMLHAPQPSSKNTFVGSLSRRSTHETGGKKQVGNQKEIPKEPWNCIT